MDDKNQKIVKKVLIVEDDFFINDIYKREAEIQGYLPISVLDGEQALKMAREGNPDAILLDLMLPKMSGLDVLKQLKSEERFKLIPIIVMSNVGDEDTIRQALALGASQYILKALTNPKNVVGAIKKYL